MHVWVHKWVNYTKRTWKMHIWVNEWGKYTKRTWNMHVLGSRLRCTSGCIASKKCLQVSHLGWDPLMGGSTKHKPEWYTREDLGNVDKNYSNLVNNKRNKKLNFNSMCIDSSLEAVADSGTTGHYITPTTPYMNKHKATQPIPIKMLNVEIITSSHIALHPQHNLPDKACKAHIFPGLQKPLISIGTFCDNNFITVFDEKGSQYMTKWQDI